MSSSKLTDSTQRKRVRTGDLVCYNPPTHIQRYRKNHRYSSVYCINNISQKLLSYTEHNAMDRAMLSYRTPSGTYTLRRGDVLLYIEFDDVRLENVVLFQNKTWTIARPVQKQVSDWMSTCPMNTHLTYSQNWHIV